VPCDVRRHHRVNGAFVDGLAAKTAAVGLACFAPGAVDAVLRLFGHLTSVAPHRAARSQ